MSGKQMLFIGAPAFAPAIPVLKDGHFALVAAQKPCDIFLVSEQHGHGYGYGESAVQRLFFIEDKKYENRESNTGKNRTQGYKACEI